MINIEALKELTLLLSAGDESSSEDVALSAAEPDSYIRLHKFELQNRGISAPMPNLHWIALVDALEKKNKLIELDWKESPEMLREAAETLLANVEQTESARDSLRSIETENFGTVPKTLKRINQLLEEFGFVFIIIDIQSDCYPLTLIRLDAYPAVMKSANLVNEDRIYSFYYE